MLPPSTSIAAFHHIAPTAGGLRQEILDIIEEGGEEGVIMDEVFKLFPESSRPGGTISSRFSELEKLGLMYRAGDTRLGDSRRPQMVMRHSKFMELTGAVSPKSIRKSAFLSGLMYATKIVAKGADLGSIKSRLKEELLKAARRK